MQTKQMLLTLLVVRLSCSLVHADGVTNHPTNLKVVRHGNYTYTYMWTNHSVVYVDSSEFWPGTWKEDTNGWRVQLCVYWETNYWVPQEGVMHPVSTNLMLSIEWGSAGKNSGGGYYMSPNGKFAKFELKDVHGNVVAPNPDAGTNLLERLLVGRSLGSSADSSRKLSYQSNLSAWVSPAAGPLVTSFPQRISNNEYPHIEYGRSAGNSSGSVIGEIASVTNRPPSVLGLLKLDEIYSVTKEGDYTLTVQPVLYKKQIGTNVLDRVDLPSVTAKVHLVPNEK